VDFEGTPLNKKAKLLRLWNADFYKTVYAMLARSEAFAEPLPEPSESEILELPE